jgi:lipid II:glycine glycyltransferase (peptidoglycan interpeptide bridge formation enzyme)
MGQKTWLLEYDAGRENPVRALVTKVEARRGTFLYLPYGPLMKNLSDRESLEGFFVELRKKAMEENATFIRVSPYWPENETNQQLLKSLGFHPAPIHMLAETLWVLDLDGKNEEELLAQMDKKHRNLVRRAEKDGVTIASTVDPEAVERFIALHWQTVGRHKFTPYPKSYFRHQVEIFARQNEVKVLEAYYQNELLASAIIMYFGKAGAYHHGASSSLPEHRKIPASYLLQWEAIKEAKKRDCTSYNFWGIAPDTASSKHPFYGITHFKTGFGGRRIDLMPCQDLKINAKYYVNWGIEKFRKWKRGF